MRDAFQFVIPGRELRQLRASPESISPGEHDTDDIATTRSCSVWIPGLRRSRLSPTAAHPGMTTF
jgi:hypothetical protein